MANFYDPPRVLCLFLVYHSRELNRDHFQHPTEASHNSTFRWATVYAVYIQHRKILSSSKPMPLVDEGLRVSVYKSALTPKKKKEKKKRNAREKQNSMKWRLFPEVSSLVSAVRGQADVSVTWACFASLLPGALIKEDLTKETCISFLCWDACKVVCKVVCNPKTKGTVHEPSQLGRLPLPTVNVNTIDIT